MTRIFGKIRSKLLSANRLSRYIAYAIGEIILVVIGILIAIQINNWNQEKLDRDFELTMLKDIKSSLESDLEYYEYSIASMSRREDAIQKLLSMISSGKTYPDSTLLEAYNAMTVGNIFLYNKGGYEALKSVGLDKISNDSLRKELILLYEVDYPEIQSFYNVVIDSAPRNKEYKLELHNKLWERVQIQMADNSYKIVSRPINASEFLQQKELIERIKIEQDNLNFTMIRMPQIEGIIKKTIELVNAEINNH